MMSILNRALAKTSQFRFSSWIVLAVFAIWAVLRTGHSVLLLMPADTWNEHDLRLIFNTWKQFLQDGQAKEAMQTITYLPYVWWGMTPLFSLGWETTKMVWCAANFAFAFYVCHRLGDLLGLGRFERFALIVFFFSWLSTGLVIGLGNFAMVSLAATLAAFPFQTQTRSLWLVPAAFKHSLTYPVYLHLLIRKPGKVLIPAMVLSLLVLLSMVWAGIGLEGLMDGLKNGQAISRVWMHENRTLSLVPIFEGLLGQNLVAQFVNWALWFVLFGSSMVFIRNPLVLLAALLLLALLPMHHRDYDMIVAVPALALFLKHYGFVWSALMTLSLAGLPDHLENKLHEPPLLKLLDQLYYPVEILFLVGVLSLLDWQLRRNQLENKTPTAPA